jgi:hypothetical protein
MAENNNVTRDGSVGRRMFVSGMTALGVGGAAGCLSDGGGDGTASPGEETTETTDASTDEGSTDTSTDETATDTPSDGTPTDTPASPEGVPTGLTYQFYEGVESLSNLEDSTPTSSGDVTHMTTELEDGTGAFRFTGELVLGPRLPAGAYTFTSDLADSSEDRLRMSVNGNEIQFTTTTWELRLPEGTHDLTVDFLRESADDQVNLGWKGPMGSLLPRIAESDPFRGEIKEGGKYEIHVGDRLETKQMQMPNSGSDSSKRSLAVGPTSYRNFCVDLNTGNVPYAWFGAFLDYGPMVSYGGGRGDSPGQPLGTTFDVGGVDYPVRIGSVEEEPTVEFVAHRERPTFELHYDVDGTRVVQQVEGVSGEMGLTYTVQFEELPSKTVYFLTDPDAPIDREASVGTWNGGELQISERVEEFTVTVTNTEVGP